MSAQGFYRFAAADSASDAFRPKAISYVMAGGLLSALIGPQLVKVTTDATVVPFFGTYAVVVLINLWARALSRARPAQTRPAARGRARGPNPDGASEGPEDRRGHHLRHGLLRADEPDDDLDAAGDGGLRLHHRDGGRCGLGPCHRDVRAVLLHRPSDRALRAMRIVGTGLSCWRWRAPWR
jgi:hypothetical protein